ncbi:uncharacterized protein E0L32_010611 [Thyridium curvatum]|uniref:Uncharacterized protein n=1 Tax=Thyridium curvatum TaxID=1093900 RepID=A0A507AEJ6_9PEZI|nr:uncharacterized protein E0L32_010611 [Thyridium curvatum]TPX07715.1 hypothetical protein E0L32_010611 [Thyridium curvatum]
MVRKTFKRRPKPEAQGQPAAVLRNRARTIQNPIRYVGSLIGASNSRVAVLRLLHMLLLVALVVLIALLARYVHALTDKVQSSLFGFVPIQSLPFQTHHQQVTILHPHPAAKLVTTMPRNSIRRTMVEDHDEPADPAPPQSSGRPAEMARSLARPRQMSVVADEQDNGNGNALIAQQTSPWAMAANSSSERLAHHGLYAANHTMACLRDVIGDFLRSSDQVVFVLTGTFGILVLAFMVLCYLICNMFRSG